MKIFLNQIINWVVAKIANYRQNKNKKYFTDAERKLDKKIKDMRTSNRELLEQMQQYCTQKTQTAHNDHHRSILLKREFQFALDAQNLKFRVENGIVKLKRNSVR